MREKINEFDKFSGLERQKRKPSFLTVVLVALLLFLVCSLGYDNIVKPYLASKKHKTEKQIVTSPQEPEEVVASGSEIIVSDKTDAKAEETDVVAEEIIEKTVQRQERTSTKQMNNSPMHDSIYPKVKQDNKPAERVRPVYPEQPQKNVASTPSKSEDYSNMSTSEILERQSHARVVEQARRAGVSTEGSTTEILERISHARVVEQARRAGVSAEGSTTEILERISHARVVEQARRAGVSTEGSTTEILERMTRKRLEERGYFQK